MCIREETLTGLVDSNTVSAEMAKKAGAGRELRRFKRVEYERLAEVGLFCPGEKLELIDGLLLVREPHGTPHATAITLGLEALRAVFGAGWVARIQLPIALDEDSEPEPDLVIVRGEARDFSRAHPSSVALVVEVADSSLSFDRSDKASLYARAGVADYWIVNLIDRIVEVHRDPQPAPAAFGWRYGSVRFARPGDSVTPLALPSAALRVVDLLP
jgi:Uma2 family endonuclease